MSDEFDRKVAEAVGTTTEAIDAARARGPLLPQSQPFPYFEDLPEEVRSRCQAVGFGVFLIPLDVWLQNRNAFEGYELTRAVDYAAVAARKK